MELVYGIVENIEYKPLMIQAVLPDMDDMLSPWAMVLTSRTLNAKTFDPPIKGEQVALLLCDNGETALCMGSVFSDVDNSPVDSHAYVKQFDDGTRIKYDSDSKKLSIDAEGDVVIACKGSMTIDNDVTINGTATITEDVIIAGKSYKLHAHPVPAIGSNTSSPL